MRIAVVNRYRAHETYAARVCAALADAGHEVRYLGPNLVPAGSFHWIRTVRPQWHGPVPPMRSWVLDALDRRRWCLDDADLTIDIEAAASLWVLPRARSVRVLHRVDPFSGDSLRARSRRARLRFVARRGDRFVVHTQAARAVLVGIIGEDGCVCVPLLGPEPVPRPARPRRDPMTALFVGDDRTEKGLDLLRAAAASMGVAVRHVGSLAYPLSNDELAAEYAECDVVVCPYRDEYIAKGSASLVVSEALAYGVPVVATPALQELFPVGYRGVEFVSAASVGALADKLRSIDIACLSELAALDAPVAAEHVRPSAYVGALLAFAESIRS